MSDIVQTSIGYLSHSGDFSVRNSRTLGAVTQLWSDAFARAMADQVADSTPIPVHPSSVEVDVETGEPVAGAKTLSKIVEQRACPVADTEVKPPEPLFLPIAEFELDLLPPPAEPFSIADMIEQQRHLEFESNWVRPTVLNAHSDVTPGPAPQTRPLHLPIAELEWDLADKPALPLDEKTIATQQRQFDYENVWARPLILQNLRMAA
ncbi:energy transducer TonB [Pseudomonas viridiflava]|uniref:energy transducer TonB n=1 Tax=Pseudomonas viridiflava TaxID=33069 RepID=UPI000F03F4C0|nr:energy transducer TonB [Pseudomonas viridiflava]MCI3908704.1 energy transducer TonB [Pseudomonas viridiflava]MCQ9391170.1 energy transducer TonB [Pseudomonas viridiflava]MEE4141205.1 energy transducer TonB [Pseudomonas viridiflava]